MTVCDIPDIEENPVLSSIADSVAMRIEPFANHWVKKWEFPMPRDSVRARLAGFIGAIDACGSTQTSSLLLKALLWHYLSQCEVDSAFAKSNEIISGMLAARPACAEAVWLKGINFVRSKRIIEGLRVLDSINATGAIRNPHFAEDYMELSGACLLPSRLTSGGSTLRLLPRPAEYTARLNEREQIPAAISWRACDEKQGTRLPTFSFGTVFNVNRECPLRFGALRTVEPSRLDINVRQDILSQVRTPLVFDFDTPPCKTEVKIIVDVNQQNLSLFDYVGMIISNRFDIVRQTDDARLLHGASLRCYTVSGYKNIPGEFVAIVAFDMDIGKVSADRFYCREHGASAEKQIARYVICIKAPQSVEHKAEAILQDFLARVD
jgi:hypothetical protein